MSTLVPPDAFKTSSGSRELLRRIARRGGKSARVLISQASNLHAPWTPARNPPAETAPSDTLNWRKSARSGVNGNECIEVASDGQHVLVRDSKNRVGGTLTFSIQDWRTFLDKIETGDL